MEAEQSVESSDTNRSDGFYNCRPYKDPSESSEIFLYFKTRTGYFEAAGKAAQKTLIGSTK